MSNKLGDGLIGIIFIFSGCLMIVNAQNYCPPGKTYSDCSRNDLAFGRGSTQSLHHYGAALAVDGNYSTCSETTHVDEPFLQVDLGKDVLIQSLYIFIGQATINEMRSYVVEVQKHNSPDWQSCSSWSGQSAVRSPLNIACPSNLIGRHVRFTIPQNTTDLQLCNFGVIGACLNGTYGPYCDSQCSNCKRLTDFTQNLCNTITGQCTSGCDTGWTGLTCNSSCPSGTYGDRCQKQCGHCLLQETCNKYTGECPENRCRPGYKTPFCQLECDNGRYGVDCVPCGNCSSADPCNKITGECPNGCADGFKITDVMCMTTCSDKTWGPNCIKVCGHCRKEGSTEPGPCDLVTGECKLGCAPGYYQTSTFNCFNACQQGSWGINCARQCGNCGLTVNNTIQPVNCSTVDGACLTGCLIGWQGLLCTDTCTPGTYGKDCQQTCGHCKDPCDHITGQCPGDCENGHLGNMCTTACSKGHYGYKCSNTCPPNCQDGNCDIADGSCICKDGWTGQRCEESCPANHYGKNCDFVCGNCREGTTCNQHDGYCPDGCKEEWVGLKCGDKKIIEVYRRSYADVIGGVIGGVIALALIVPFVVWIVWRYRKDKSIHIRELASSLRRMSIRGSQRIRRSIQRLSFRSRKNQNQKRLGDNAEPPSKTTPHSHKGTASVPRMYECVKIQSNVIHYDDFSRMYMDLQGTGPQGRTLLYDSFKSFLAQRPTDHSSEQNGTPAVNGYYNTASQDEVELHVGADKLQMPAFLPLGTNLSGFLLINVPAASATLWNHLRQRQIENVITIGKEASCAWTPGESVKIGYDTVFCVDTQLYPSHRESKLTVQTQGIPGRRAVRHMECLFWNRMEQFPTIPTLLMFLDRFQQLQARQRERSIIVNFTTLQDHAILFTLVASCLEIIRESKRVDILRTVATGGKATAKAVRTFEEFKFLHDVVFQYMASSDGSTSI